MGRKLFHAVVLYSCILQLSEGKETIAPVNKTNHIVSEFDLSFRCSFLEYFTVSLKLVLLKHEARLSGSWEWDIWFREEGKVI
jgi:hypothetical protein